MWGQTFVRKKSSKMTHSINVIQINEGEHALHSEKFEDMYTIGGRNTKIYPFELFLNIIIIKECSKISLRVVVLESIFAT